MAHPRGGGQRACAPCALPKLHNAEHVPSRWNGMATEQVHLVMAMLFHVLERTRWICVHTYHRIRTHPGWERLLRPRWVQQVARQRPRVWMWTVPCRAVGCRAPMMRSWPVAASVPW